MSDPQNLEGDRYDTMAAVIVTECVGIDRAGLAGWELANLQDAIASALRARLAEVEAENERLRTALREIAENGHGFGGITGVLARDARAALNPKEQSHDE